MQADSSEALIFTTKGNVLLNSLERKDGWEFSPNGVLYWEEYYQGDELVKRSVAIFQLPEGETLSLTQGAIQ